MDPRLGPLLVFAPDLDVAERFYADVLGLTLLEATDRHRTLSGEGFTLAVFVCADDAPPEGHAVRPGVAVTFSVPSLDEARAELAAKGVHFLHERPQEGPLGRYVAFTDPFGTVYELVETG